jgi:hypothetical protein
MPAPACTAKMAGVGGLASLRDLSVSMLGEDARLAARE